MELIHPEYVKYVYEVNRLRIKLAELITYRDSLKYHITKSLSIDYMLKIGALEYKLLQIRNLIEKDNRLIELITVNNLSFNEAENIVKKEFLERDCKIALMNEAVEKAISDSHKKVVNEKELIELNSYYMPLVRDFSPEINPNISNESKLLFETIKDKYISGSISEMKKFERFEKSEMYFDELEVYKTEKTRLLKLAEDVNAETVNIKGMYPYTERLELTDENLFRRRKDTINQKISEEKKVLDDLEKQINKLKK